jgi:DNA-binding SARP family transcriptional activator
MRDGQRVALPARRSRELLASLAIEPDCSAQREQICARIWPDMSDFNARKALNTELWRLRTAIKDAGGDAAAWLESTPDAVRLCTDNGIAVDVQRFRSAIEASNDAEVEMLVAAVDAYRGEFAADLDAEWLEDVRRELKSHFVRLLDTVVDGLRRAERFATAFAYAERLIREEPFDERGHRALLLIQIQSGDHSAAVRHYRQLEETFQRELGILPSPETRAVLGSVIAEPVEHGRFSITAETARAKFDLADTRARVLQLRRGAEMLVAELCELEKRLFR